MQSGRTTLGMVKCLLDVHFRISVKVVGHLDTLGIFFISMTMLVIFF